MTSASANTVVQEIEVDVPVSTAYNQWTQFEEFPKFMEGVDEVKQLDDTLLHWAATVAGKKAEWDAKIIEQEPDRRIAWESVDGKRTRGTVTFEQAGLTEPRPAEHAVHARGRRREGRFGRESRRPPRPWRPGAFSPS